MRTELTPEQQISRMNRRSLLVGGVAAIAGFASFRWLTANEPESGTSWPLRRNLENNERIAGSLYSRNRLAAEHPISSAGIPTENGHIGLDDGEFEVVRWKLQLNGVRQPMELTLADIKELPRIEMITELKCIEGWSQVVCWAGARFADFANRYAPGETLQYVGMNTPDDDYFVGLDMESAMHSQTLLCYEMDRAPLTLAHGAPLRLVIPVKYGIKNIKRIGTIEFSNKRPEDYWAKEGYDWYAGL